jgi:hypothetical protein
LERGVTAGSVVVLVPDAGASQRGPVLLRVSGMITPGTTPAKLRLLLAGLLASFVLWGTAAALTVAAHASAAANVVSVSEPLSVDAQQIYRSLSDADATEAAAFLSGGLEPLPLRHRYQDDIARAALRLEDATAAAGSSAAGSRLAVLAAGLPVYAGLVETARADNRLGLPLGAAYLRQASGLMRATLLPAARDLYAQENGQLAAADRQATGFPYIALVLAVITGSGLFFGQVWLTRSTNRLINPGLLLASIAGLVTLIWLVSALSFATAHLISARDQGSAPVEALARADIAALRAHADESLTLIDRGGDDSFQKDFLSLQERLGPGQGTQLTAAAESAHGSPGGRLAMSAARTAPVWYAVHERVRSLDDGGRYPAAVQLAIGSQPGDSGELFGRLDADLGGAIAADQAAFRTAALAGQNDLAGLETGVIVLSVLMAAGCTWGIFQRLADYQ